MFFLILLILEIKKISKLGHLGAVWIAHPRFLPFFFFFFYNAFCFRQGTIITVHVLSSTVHTL